MSVDLPSDAPPSARVRPFIASAGDLVYLWGGQGDTEPETVFLFHRDDKTWARQRTRGPHPPARLSSGSCCISGKHLYIYGGYDGKSRCGTLYELNTNSWTWRKLSDGGARGPGKKSRCRMIPYQDQLLVVGGSYDEMPSSRQAGASYVRGYTNEVHCFNLTTGLWSSPSVKGSRPPPCDSFSLTVTDEDQAVMFGGHTPSGESSKAHILHLPTMTWTKHTEGDPWPKGRDNHIAACLGYGGQHKTLLISGGWNDDILDDMWLLDLQSGRMEELQVPEKYKKLVWRYGHKAAALTVKSDCVEVILFGGCDKHSSIMAETTIFRFEWQKKLEGGKWTLTDIADDTARLAQIREDQLQKRVAEAERAGDPERRAEDPERRAEESERRAEESERRAEEWKRRAEESERRAEDSEKRAEECKRRAEEWERRAGDPERKAEDPERRAEESERRAEDSTRIAEAWKRRAEEWERRAEESERRAEDSEKRAEECKRRAEEWERRAGDPERRAEDPERRAEESERRAEDSTRIAEAWKRRAEEWERRAEDSQRRAEETERIAEAADKRVHKLKKSMADTTQNLRQYKMMTEEIEPELLKEYPQLPVARRNKGNTTITHSGFSAEKEISVAYEGEKSSVIWKEGGILMKFEEDKNHGLQDATKFSIQMFNSEGSYSRLPSNSEVASQVYFINSSKPLKRTATIRIYHQTREVDIDQLCFLTSTDEQPPYDFNNLKGGQFTSAYGEITVERFSFFTICHLMNQYGFRGILYYMENSYEASLYRSKQPSSQGSKLKWKLYLSVTKNCLVFRSCLKHYIKEEFNEDIELVSKFIVKLNRTADSITASMSMGTLPPSQGQVRLYEPNTTSFQKTDIKNYVDGCPPAFVYRLLAMPSSKFNIEFVMEGFERNCKFNFDQDHLQELCSTTSQRTIPSGITELRPILPPQRSISVSSTSSDSQDLKCRTIMRLFRDKFPASNARILGTYLDISYAKLQELKQDNSSDAEGFLLDIINYWLENDTEKSWTKLAEAVEDCGYKLLAEKARSMESVSPCAK